MIRRLRGATRGLGARSKFNVPATSGKKALLANARPSTILFWAMPKDGNQRMCGIGNHVAWRGLPCFRNSENVQMKKRLAVAGGYRGSCLHKAGESGDDLTDFTGMFEPVIIAFSVAVVGHHIGQTERTQYITHARHASSDRAGDLAGTTALRATFKVQCLMFNVEAGEGTPWLHLQQQLSDCECHRIAEQAAQTRLPVAVLFHAASLSRFRNSENVERVRLSGSNFAEPVGCAIQGRTTET
jgi:hypothetical protein